LQSELEEDVDEEEQVNFYDWFKYKN